METIINTIAAEKRPDLFGRHVVASGRPAKFLRDALMTGNGQQRLLVFGNPAEETILLAQEDLYIPNWKTPPSAPPAAGVLDEVRQLLLEGKYEEASYRSIHASLANGVSDKYHPARPHPAFALRLAQPLQGTARDYYRSANMHSGVVTVQWTDDSGTFKRESLVPRTPENVALTRLSGPDGGSFEVRLSLLSENGKNPFLGMDSLDGSRPVVAEVAEGAYDWAAWTVDKTARFDKRPGLPEAKVTLLEDAILLTGLYDPQFEKGGWAAAILVKGADTTTRLEANQLVVQSSGPVTLLMKAAPFPHQAIGTVERLLEELRGVQGDFQSFVTANERTHGAMFDRLEVGLGGDEADYLLTTEELLEKQRLTQGILPAYIEKMVDMGRYFLLCESGKWPPIYGHVNINVNHQVSSANIGALPEMMDVFMRWIEWQLPDARENARLVFGADGFLVACHPDTESGKLYHFSHLYPHHYWISGSGWCLQPFLEHYYCTGDEDFLKNRMLPLYQELARFYQDYLKLTDSNGKWIFAPSYSPENWPSNTRIQTAINATMDITVCREVLTTLLELGPKVGVGSDEERATWQNLLDGLPDYLVDTHGELKEWAWPSLEERYNHRHLSHLYGAYPGDEFQPENDTALYRAAFIANRMRAQENSSAHGIIHRAQIAARLKDAYFVYQNLKQILETGFVNDSFSTRHNPYVQHYFPDAQGGLPTIVLEALVYARPGVLEVLPALPWCWPKGELKGLAARTFLTVEKLDWDLVKGEISLQVRSLKDQELTLIYRGKFGNITMDGAGVAFEAARHSCKVWLEQNREVVIRITGARMPDKL